MPRNPDNPRGPVGPLIPIDDVHPIVKDYCDSRDMGEIMFQKRKSTNNPDQGNTYLTNTAQKYSAIDALANESGVSYGRVSAIYYKRPKNVTFDTVDKLLTGMERLDLWYQEPLSTYYVLDSAPEDEPVRKRAAAPEPRASGTVPLSRGNPEFERASLGWAFRARVGNGSRVPAKS